MLSLDPQIPQDTASEALLSVAQVLKSAADPLRMEILSALATDSFGVSELSTLFDVKQSGMSHHLKVLANADLVTTRREGNSIFYLRNNCLPKRCQQNDTLENKVLNTALNSDEHKISDTRYKLREDIYRCADALELTKNVSQRLNDIYRSRAAASAAFFVEHSEKFREQQELIASFEVYSTPLSQWIEVLEAKNSALEIGPGTGDFLPFLSDEFNRVVALDSSATMLEKSRALADKNQLTNIHFVHADTKFCRQLANHELFDCIVVNMVLHHTPSPAPFIADLSQALSPGGSLFISDLCRHDQDWTRDACGDQWLGFEPKDIHQWCIENKLNETQQTYITLRNGFQIQIRQFIKIN